MSPTFSRLILVILFTGTVLLSTASPSLAQRPRFQEGDRVEVDRGIEWSKATVIGFDRNRIVVRLDDDGKHSDLSADMLERRLTRKDDSSDVRKLRGEAANAPAPASTASPAASVEPRATTRTWSDKSGRFNIEASYRGMDGEKVVLEKSDGSRIKVPLAKLSEADQKFVASQGADSENPFAVAASSPAVPTGPVRGESDFSKLMTISPESFTDWTFTPSPAPIQAAGVGKKKIRLKDIPHSDKFFETTEQIDISNDGQRALVLRKKGVVGDDLFFIEQIDLAAGRSLGLGEIPFGMELLSMSADHGMVVYRPQTFKGDQSELTVSRFSNGKLNPIAIWRPYANQESDHRFSHDREVDAAWIVGPGRIMTTKGHAGNKLTLWDVASLSATHDIGVGHGFRSKQLGMSPNGRLCAVAMDKGVAIIDLVLGTHVGTLPVGDGGGFHVGQFAFNSDNTRLVATAFRNVMVWDLSTGELVREFRHRSLSTFNPCYWMGDFLFQNDRHIFDYERRILLWELNGISSHEGASVAKGGMVCLVAGVSRNTTTMLHAIPMPTQEMVDLANELGDPESLIAAREGDEISIELDIDPNIASEEEIRNALTESLQKSGFVVVENAPMVAKGVCKQLESRTIRVNMGRSIRPRPQDIQERTITPHPTYLTITKNGDELWRIGSRGQPGGMVWLEKGETLDQALTRITTPNISLLKNAHVILPLAQPGKATKSGAYGVTNLGTGGRGARFE